MPPSGLPRGCEMTSNSKPTSLNILVVSQDRVTRKIFVGVIDEPDELSFASSIEDAMLQASAGVSDLVFVDTTVENNAGVALVHHLKVVQPNVRVYALVRTEALKQGAEALSVGAAGLIVLASGRR